MQNLILDKIKNKKAWGSNFNINKKFHKLNFQENEIIKILKKKQTQNF